MPFADQYLAHQSVSGWIKSTPRPDLHYIVVIPCYDEPGLLHTLDSLWDCERPDGAVEILIVINSPIDAPDPVIEQNRQTIAGVSKWANAHTSQKFQVFNTNDFGLPNKYAGPGLARKIGMDEAVLRFNKLGRPDGVILSLDADCTVNRNYFVEVERQFAREPETRSCAIYFEHPLEGDAFDCAVYEAIAAYELHMRYYIQAIRNTGFPYAYHTIGSCFCVTAETYAKQGGMNKRKGGEDFYFLQKTIPLGDFYEINSTCVYPSPRPSRRVPFGTGPAVWEYLLRGEELLTYDPQSFLPLNLLFDRPEKLFLAGPLPVRRYLEALPDPIRSFLQDEFEAKITEINSNCAYPESFSKRFHHWFNMFKILKYLHSAHENNFSKLPVSRAAHDLLKEMGLPAKTDIPGLLVTYRNLQRNQLPFASVNE